MTGWLIALSIVVFYLISILVGIRWYNKYTGREPDWDEFAMAFPLLVWFAPFITTALGLMLFSRNHLRGGGIAGFVLPVERDKKEYLKLDREYTSLRDEYNRLGWAAQRDGKHDDYRVFKDAAEGYQAVANKISDERYKTNPMPIKKFKKQHGLN